MKMARTLVFFGLIFLLLPLGQVWAQSKIAVVDINKCVQLTDQGKVAYKDLKAEVDKIQNELNAKEKEIEEIRTKLEKGAGLLSESARFSLESEVGRKSRAYRELYEESQARIRQLEMERTRPIFNQTMALIRDIGLQEGYDLVLNSRAGVIYANAAVDITNQVIKAYNEKYPASAKPGQKKAK